MLVVAILGASIDSSALTQSLLSALFIANWQMANFLLRLECLVMQDSKTVLVTVNWTCQGEGLHANASRCRCRGKRRLEWKLTTGKVLGGSLADIMTSRINII